MNARTLVASLVMLVLLSGVCLAQAPCPQGPEMKLWGSLDSKPKIADSYDPDKVEIGIGSYKLLELTGPAAGYTLAEREVAVYNRLTEALSIGPVTPGMICVGRVRSAPTVYVGPVRFVSVYAKDAAAVGLTQEQLAWQWRDRLAQVLPKITAPTAGEVPETAAPGAAAAPAVAPDQALMTGQVYEVAVGGILLFRLRGKDGFDSLEARGLAAEKQIVRMLSDGSYNKATAAPQAVDGQWVVMFGNQRVVTATAEDAAANKATPEQLVTSWSARLNSLLPTLKGSTGGGLLPE